MVVPTEYRMFQCVGCGTRRVIHTDCRAPWDRCLACKDRLRLLGWLRPPVGSTMFAAFTDAVVELDAAQQEEWRRLLEENKRRGSDFDQEKRDREEWERDGSKW